MPVYPVLSPRVIGQAEKALNAILDRLLAGTGLTEPLWVTLTLTLTAASGGTLDRNQLAARVADAVAVSETEAQARITKLADAQFLEVPGAEGSPVRLTAAGQQVHGQVSAATTRIAKQLWEELPAEDLAIAGRVLSIITARANATISTNNLTSK